MRFSISSITVFVFLLICQVCTASILVESKTDNIMLFPRDGAVPAAHGSGSQATPSPSPSPPVRKARAPTIWASPEILQNGTLFYIAISISTLLWCTGKGVDMSLDQQERRAEYMARR